MGVMMQAFYWDCPTDAGRERAWWPFIQNNLPALSNAGFTALWLPPAGKAASIESMGYDPYDLFDLGEFDQRGGVSTWFGSKDELTDLIAAAHAVGMQVYADMVLNQSSGGTQEHNPDFNVDNYTLFEPASNRFARDWKCFHPCRYETIDEMVFGGMPDLCHRNPYVFTNLLEYGKWILETIGYDGFRFDFVKGYGAWMVRAIQELRAVHADRALVPFGVAENWSDTRPIDDWLIEVNTWTDNPVSAFDFPLRWKLQALCQQFGFNMQRLADNDTVVSNNARLAVTFVENHDVERSSPITTDKMLAYSFILTHEGYPCVFWRDYFNYGLALPDQPSGINALVTAHERYAGGGTQILYVDNDLYIMQRQGTPEQTGLVYVLNNRGSWYGTTVQTQWSNKLFNPVAWRGENDLGQPQAKRTDQAGRSDFWAPPRGYAVYIPQD